MKRSVRQHEGIAPRLIGAVLLGMLIALGCALEPINGDTFSGSNVGRVIQFYGYATVSGASMNVEVLDPPDQDPHDPSSTWRSLATTNAGTTAIYWTSEDPLYYWSVDAIPVAGSPDQYLWPEGGLTRLRIRQNGTAVITFDDAGCIGENLFEPIETIAANCMSHDSGVLTLVDTNPVSNPDGEFLSFKATPLSEARQYYQTIDAGPDDERFTFAGWLNANGFEPSLYSFPIDFDPGNDGGFVVDLPNGLPSTVVGTPQFGFDPLSIQRLAAGRSQEVAAIRAAGWQASAALPAFRSAQAEELDNSVDSTFLDPALTAVPILEDVSAIYRNAADLGFGREMHCRQKEDGGAACYVTNYGDPETAAEDSLDDAIQHRNPVATVAMEYVPSAARDKVRFYVYDGLGNRLEEAELDGQGAKAVPGVCLACHQGSYDAAKDSVTSARFLPFDIASFEYTSTSGYTRSEQEDAFRKLNRIVLETNSTVATAELVEGWYAASGGVYSEDASFDESFVPVEWASERKLYDEVVKPYCRTCHVAKGSGSGLDFRSAEDFKSLASLIDLRVCGETSFRSMPQAEVTYDDFWNSGARAHLVGALGLTTSCAGE